MPIKKVIDALQSKVDNNPEKRFTIAEVRAAIQDNYFSLSKRVMQAAKNEGVAALANDNIFPILDKLGLSPDDLRPELEDAFNLVLGAMCIDFKNDHNCDKTGFRYARMVVNETHSGRYRAPPAITQFPNVKNTDTLITLYGITVESMCSHHFQNIRGVCHIAILPDPNGKVAGLSKYTRIVKHFAERPQIQEELTVQIADELMKVLSPLGVAVVIDAEHQCMSVRGVREHESIMRTTHLLGDFQDVPHLKAEFMNNVPMPRPYR